MRSIYFRYSLFILICFFSASCNVKDKKTDNEENATPNIIFILADDLGYGDLGCYGQKKIRTPNIDRLAAEGMKFTDFYAGNTVCAPSRCALMTGKHMGHALIRANSLVPLSEGDSTLAQILQKKGYVTGMFGKWGLGEYGTSGTPEKKGFDRFMGFLNQRDAHKYYFDSMEVIRDDQLERISIDSNRYTHDILMEASFDFVKENKETPFFLYMPVTIPHAELLLPDEDMALYLDENERSIFEETPFEGNWLYRAQKMPKAAFAGMITRLDKDVGELISLLKELGLEDRTYVFFTSDNGPHAEGGIDPTDFNSNGPFRGFKRDLYEGGIRVPMIVRGPEVPAASINNNTGAFWDILPTIADLINYRVGFSNDGISLLPALKDPDYELNHPYLYWEHYIRWEKEFTQAVREGPWKALRIGVEDQTVLLELYNLEKDLGETNDLSEKMPDKMQEMVNLMESASDKPENDEFIYYKDFFEK